MPSTQESRLVGHLGPDTLSEDWSHTIATVNRQPDRRIREALLDQRNVCRIGNLWAVESLFVSGVWPHSPVAEVDTARVLKLVGRMMRLGMRNGTRSQRAAPGAVRRTGVRPVSPAVPAERNLDCPFP